MNSRILLCGRSNLRLYVLLITLLTLTTISVKAQYYSPPTTIRTPYGNVTTPGTYHPGHYYNTGPTKYKFTIVLKEYPDSVIEAKSAIWSNDSTQFLKFRHNGKKIRVTSAETKEISRVLTDSKEKYVGFATDSCWLFKSVEGKIIGYSSSAEKGYGFVIAIQQDNGPIVPLTKENLEPIIKDHPEAMKYLGKKKLKDAVKAFNKPASSKK